MPCSARAPIRTSVVGAIAQSAEVTPKPTRPETNISLRPNLSPSEPPTSSSATRASRYASTTHCCPESPASRSSAIAGSATLTTVASRKTTVDPMIAATSVHRWVEVMRSSLAKRRRDLSDVPVRIQGMRRILGVVATALAALAVVAPGAAAASGTAGPSVIFNGDGVTGPPGTPASAMRYSTIVDNRGTTVLATETDGGEVRKQRSLGDIWAPLAVTIEGREAGGLSADGETLVLGQTPSGLNPEKTSFLVLDTQRLRVRERVDLPGFVSFDAISPDGRLLYLVTYDSATNPFDYSVRVYDVEAGKYKAGEIVDPSEPDEEMAGQPVAREMSPDGRWAYTLYGGGEEAFIHALDTEGETAVCVDLENIPPGDAYRHGLAVAAGTGAISVMRGGEPVATVDPESFEVSRVVEEVVPGPQEDGGSAWPLAAALGAVALAAIGLLAVRRRRRRANEAELGDIFAGAQSTEAEEREREAEPVP